MYCIRDTRQSTQSVRTRVKVTAIRVNCLHEAKNKYV